MATFPTLTPSSRSFTPGRHPHSEIRTLDGLQTRVRTSNVLLEQRLRLTFVALTETQMLSIRSHYNTQQGRFLSFNIPDSLLSGMTTPANFTPTGYSWIYADTPTVEDIGLQRYTVSVELVTVPPEGATISGADYTVTLGLSSGTIVTTTDVYIPAAINIQVASIVPAITIVSPGDADALAYIAAVEAADGQALETVVKDAIQAFVVGCKTDGIWTAIQASCILGCARTLTGALVPLRGSAPTNSNFVTADYDRKTGLKGNGTNKSLNANRDISADNLNNCHAAIYQSELDTTQNESFWAGDDTSRSYILVTSGGTSLGCRIPGFSFIASKAADTLMGVSRSDSASFISRTGASTATVTATSVASSGATFIFRRGTASAFCNARMFFYSLGSSVDLGLLQTRVSALKTAISGI